MFSIYNISCIMLNNLHEKNPKIPTGFFLLCNNIIVRQEMILCMEIPIGDIRAFNIEEIIKKDEKDLEIEKLKDEINELKGMIKDAKHVASNDDGTTTVKKSKNVSNDNTSSE